MAITYIQGITGSGKTKGFIFPLFQNLKSYNRALIFGRRQHVDALDEIYPSNHVKIDIQKFSYQEIKNYLEESIDHKIVSIFNEYGPEPPRFNEIINNLIWFMIKTFENNTKTLVIVEEHTQVDEIFKLILSTKTEIDFVITSQLNKLNYDELMIIDNLIVGGNYFPGAQSEIIASLSPQISSLRNRHFLKFKKGELISKIFLNKMCENDFNKKAGNCP